MIDQIQTRQDLDGQLEREVKLFWQLFKVIVLSFLSGAMIFSTLAYLILKDSIQAKHSNLAVDKVCEDRKVLSVMAAKEGVHQFLREFGLTYKKGK